MNGDLIIRAWFDEDFVIPAAAASADNPPFRGPRLAAMMAAVILAWQPPDPIVIQPRSTPRVHVKFDLPTPSTFANDFVMVRANDPPEQYLPIVKPNGTRRMHTPFDFPPPSSNADMFEVVRLNDSPIPIPPVVAFNGSPRVHVRFDSPPPSTYAGLFQLIRLNDAPTPVPPVVVFNGSPRTHVRFDLAPGGPNNQNSMASAWWPAEVQMQLRPRTVPLVVVFTPDFPPPSSTDNLHSILGWWDVPPPQPQARLQTNPRLHVPFDLPPASTVWQQLALALQTWIPPPPIPALVGFKGSPRTFVAFDLPTPQSKAGLNSIVAGWIILPGNILSTARVPSGTVFVPDNPPRLSLAVLNSILSTWNLALPMLLTAQRLNPRVFVAYDIPVPSLDRAREIAVGLWNLPDPRLSIVGFKGSPKTFSGADAPPPSRRELATLLSWQDPPTFQRIVQRILLGKADNPPPRTLVNLFNTIDQWRSQGLIDQAVFARYNKIPIPVEFVVNYLASMGLSERIVDILVSHGAEIDARGRIFIDVSNLSEVDVRRLIDIATGKST